MFTDMSNTIEDDELSKTLDGSGNGDEWNLNHVTTGSQIPNQDEQSNQQKVATTTKWLPLDNKEQQQNDGRIIIGDRSFTISTSKANFQNDQLNNEPNKRFDIFTPDSSSLNSGLKDVNEFISVVNNQSNIVFTEPVEDVIKYSSSERSSTSFVAGSYPNSSNNNNNNHTTVTRYGWKSHSNNEPIGSIIKMINNSTNSSSSSPNQVPGITIHLNHESGKSNATHSSGDGHNEDEERNKIYKSYSMVNGALKKGQPMIESLNSNKDNNNNNNGTQTNKQMISYSPTNQIQLARPASPDGGGQENSQVEHHHVLLTIASNPPITSAQKKPSHIPDHHHSHQNMLRAPLIITQDQLRMIAESEDDSSPLLSSNHLSPYHKRLAQKALNHQNHHPAKDSFMFDASLLPAMTMSLASPSPSSPSLISSSSSVSASELMPQTESIFDPPTQPFGSNHFRKTIPTSGNQQHQDGSIKYMQTTGGSHRMNPHQFGSNGQANELYYEPILVKTNPEVGSLDGAQVSGVQSGDSKESSNDDSDGGSDLNFDTAQDDSSGDETSDSASDNDLPVDSDDQQSNLSLKNGNKMKTLDSKPAKLDTKYHEMARKKKRKKYDQDHDRKHQEQQPKQQQQPKEAKSKQTADQELLVGPFKSESEAPATITLAGVVYQKSGSSSQASIVKSSHPKLMLQKQFSLSEAAGTGSGSGNGHVAQQIKQLPTNTKANTNVESSSSQHHQIEKYWPYSSVYAPQSVTGSSSSSQSGAQQQLASISDILLASMKNGELDPIRLQRPSSMSSSSLDGGLRLSPFSLSPGALLAASSNTNNHHNQLGGASSSSSSDSSPQFELDLLNPPNELTGSMINFKHPPMSPSEAITSMLLESAATSAASSLSGSGSSGQLDQTSPAANPVWASSSNKGEQYYLGNLNSAQTENSYHHHHAKHGNEKHTQAQGPIVIVQKDVKPMKYHLLRAYLKLRRLLRPFEATYVFPNDGHSLMRRGQRSIRASINSRLGGKMGARKELEAAKVAE